MKFSVQYGKTRRAGPGRDGPEAEQQCGRIAARRNEGLAAGLRVAGGGAKKEERIGGVKKPGRAWCRNAPAVAAYDFPGPAACRAVPFGIDDVGRNVGSGTVGPSNDTPAFAVTARAAWRREGGRAADPSAQRVLTLAGGGGPNGSRSEARRVNPQRMWCDALGLTVTVCHYPPGCPEWNPIERRLSSQTSINWSGARLRTVAVMPGDLRGTTTKTGLRVSAHVDENTYQRGRKVG